MLKAGVFMSAHAYKDSRNSSSPSTDISQAWHSPSLVERFQAQLNCAPLPMSLHVKYATKILLNGAARNQTNRDGVNKEEINKYGEDRQRW